MSFSGLHSLPHDLLLLIWLVWGVMTLFRVSLELMSLWRTGEEEAGIFIARRKSPCSILRAKTSAVACISCHRYMIIIRPSLLVVSYVELLKNIYYSCMMPSVTLSHTRHAWLQWLRLTRKENDISLREKRGKDDNHVSVTGYSRCWRFVCRCIISWILLCWVYEKNTLNCSLTNRQHWTYAPFWLTTGTTSDQQKQQSSTRDTHHTVSHH